MALPLMRKATAVWLVENTSLTFNQIANFCGLHELEVSGIADGEVANGIRGMDPISSNQLTAEDIKKCEKDPNSILELAVNSITVGEEKRRGPRYTPLSKRQDKPAAIAWLVKFHPELTDSQIIKLVGTTKPTIKAVKTRTHWNIINIVPTDPVILGLCKQVELESAILKSSNKIHKPTSEVSENSENKLISILKDEVKQKPEIVENVSDDIKDLKIPFGFKANLWKKQPLPVGEIVTFDKDGFGENPVDVLGSRNDITGEKFYEFSRRMVNKGATILGGCCETKPFHIAAISKLKQI